MDDYQVSTLAVELVGNVNAAKRGTVALLSQIALNLLNSAKLVIMCMIIMILTITVDAIYWKSFSTDPKRGTLFLTLEAQINPNKAQGACRMLTVGLGAIAGLLNKFLATIGVTVMEKNKLMYAEM